MKLWMKIVVLLFAIRLQLAELVGNNSQNLWETTRRTCGKQLTTASELVGTILFMASQHAVLLFYNAIWKP